VGTGTGAIGLAVADEHAGAVVTGIDVSRDALTLARENAERTGLALSLHEHDYRDGLPEGPWDAVLANPPYVHPQAEALLEPEVREHEPGVALFATDAYAAIAPAALEVLDPGGVIVVEVGDGQATTVAELLSATGFRNVEVTNDLTGRERVVEGRRGG
jgi:release factor glutamine methyltransferase